MDIDEKFHVFLRSGASLDVFPRNKPSSFVNEISPSITLNEEHCVALSEILIPLDFGEKTSTKFFVGIVKGDAKFIGSINEFSFTQNQRMRDILPAFNRLIHQKLEDIVVKQNDRVTQLPSFQHDEIQNRIFFTQGQTLNGFHFRINFLDDRFTTCCGFDNADFHRFFQTIPSSISETLYAGDPPTLPKYLGPVYIEIDIVRGSKRTIRVIPVTKEPHDQMQHHIFSEKYYFPVQRHPIERIGVRLVDSKKQTLYFRSGEVFLTLVFKKVFKMGLSSGG